MHGGEKCGAYLRAAKHPALIVFDLDGTIADSRDMARESYKRVFAMMGYGMITDELADSFNGPDADEVCRVMGIGPDRRELYDKLVDQNDVELMSTMGRMFPGTIRMFDELAPHATLAILTNGSQRYCEASIEAFALSPYIVLHSGFVSGVTKAQRIRQWQGETGATIVIVVGDRVTDIENARAAGAYAIGVTYGMGDRVMPEIARAARNGFNMHLLKKLPQVAFVADRKYADSLGDEPLRLYPFERCLKDKRAFGENFRRIETESNRMEARTLIEETEGRFVVVNPPYPKLSEQELDRSFALPYTRLPHPRYNGKGDIPAYEMIKFSVNLHRGCFGGCSFCTISAHQGKFVSSRSERSVLDEVRAITVIPGFKGYLSDLGGPSANMYRMGGRNEALCRRCSRPSCLFPAPCRNLRNDHRPLIELYRRVDRVPGIKKSFIGSGIRYDLFEKDDWEYLREVIRRHVSGRLKVAPEHTEDGVLKLMRKPSFALFRTLNERFGRICREEGLNYQLIPYFISSHPGCTERDMRRLSDETRRLHFRLEQVQDLTPTPMTLSSVMFYTGENPYTGEKVYVARSQEEKRRQKSYFFEWQKDRRKK